MEIEKQDWVIKMTKNKKILKAFKGAEADTKGSAGGKAMSPGTSTTGGTRGPTRDGGSKIGPVVKDVPFKKPLGKVTSVILSSTIPFLGSAINYGAKQNYKGRQNFAKKEGLYRDVYKTTGKTLQPNSLTGKKYIKDAGYNKQTTTIDRDEGKRILPKPTQAAKAATVNETSYKRPTVTDGLFNYTVNLKKGGMLRQGKPKLAKKGWK
tara:strand:- start:418 stop:1041 length:624 start_codon:yes stop_codon:yes gene_type:complete